jgi:hypothetical protein
VVAGRDQDVPAFVSGQPLSAHRAPDVWAEDKSAMKAALSP